MKKDCFRVYFENGDYQDVYAFTRAEASILAQARQIEAGRIFAIDPYRPPVILQ